MKEIHDYVHPVKEIHDYVHHYRGYWSDGGKCRIRLYQEKGQIPVVICSQLPDNHNTSITNMAEYLAAERIGVLFRGTRSNDQTYTYCLADSV